MISDLRERFGRASMSLLPAAGPTSPSASERSACYAFVLLQWVALYKGVVALGKPPDAIHSSDPPGRSEEHTSELQSRFDLVCRLLLEKKKNIHTTSTF